ncbi:MAG TPA: hypothetical protein DCQ90_00990 [Erysipelotrichaceae bacterium]|nr:hypothetical protein [Erysipelotrichaceae bacterium]HAO60535.1 hypothetical protein [Erysipelotrichaceae bacterium]
MERKTLPRVVSAGRSSLLFMLVLTVLNLAFAFMNSNVSFPYSSYFSMFTIYVGFLSITVYDSLAVGLIYVLIGVCVLSVFLISWFLSKKKVHWFMIAFILYLLDTGFLVWISLSEGFDPAYMIDYAMHAWLLYSLGAAWIQGRKLRYWVEDEEGFTVIEEADTLQ